MRKKYPKTTTRVELGEDGKYRWTYALNMYKNPAILLTVLKIIVILFSIPLIFVLIRTAISNDWANAWGRRCGTAALRYCFLCWCCSSA